MLDRRALRLNLFSVSLFGLFATAGSVVHADSAGQSHCASPTYKLLTLTGDEDPAALAALPDLAVLIAKSDGGWQSRALSLADQAARVSQVGRYAPPPPVQIQPVRRPRAPTPSVAASTAAAKPVPGVSRGEPATTNPVTTTATTLVATQPAPATGTPGTAASTAGSTNPPKSTSVTPLPPALTKGAKPGG